MLNSFDSELYISNPFAGDGIWFLADVVILGISNPRVEPCKSSMAELSGPEPSWFILNWAITGAINNRNKKKIKSDRCIWKIIKRAEQR